MAKPLAVRLTRQKIIAIGPADVSLMVIREEIMKKIAIVSVFAIVLSGCGGMSPETSRAMATWSCSMSMNCDPSTLYGGSRSSSSSKSVNKYDNGNGRIDAWSGYQEVINGDRYCAYNDGSVISVGSDMCPSSI